MTQRRFWTPAELQLLQQAYADTLTADLARRLGRSTANVYAKARKLGLAKSAIFVAETARQRSAQIDHGGAACRFKKGETPWNLGLHYQPGGNAVKTQFRPGCLNGRALDLVVPVGSLRVNSDGYLQSKTNDRPGVQTLRWKAVHRLVWEAAHGSVPAGHAVVFRPGRFSTKVEEITDDALELVTRAELMRRNTIHNVLPKPLAKLAQLRGALNRQINRRQAQEDQP